MHDEQFVLAELGRLYIDSRALVIQLQAAQKQIADLQAAVPKPTSDVSASSGA